MESQGSIINNSEDLEECKINDSNKNLDNDLCLYLPKNIVEEISEKKTDTNEIEEQSQFSLSSVDSQNSKNHEKNPKNVEKMKNHNHQNHNHQTHNRINKNSFSFKNGNFKNNNSQKINFITNNQNFNTINNNNNTINSLNHNPIISCNNINNIIANNINNININQLESEIQMLNKLYNVNNHLNLWIDLIFGYKQRGEEAIKNFNCKFDYIILISISSFIL